MHSDQTLPEAMRKMLNSQRSDIRVSCPGIVRGVSGSHPNMRLTIQPSIALRDADGNARPFDVIHDVPLQCIGGGGWLIEVTPGVGDIVWLIFSDRPLDEWKRNGGMVEPTESRTHATQDAFAIPLSGGNGVSSNLVLRSSSGTPALEMTSTGIDIVGNLRVSGLVQGGTESFATTVTLNTHTHPIPDGGNTSTPNPG